MARFFCVARSLELAPDKPLWSAGRSRLGKGHVRPWVGRSSRREAGGGGRGSSALTRGSPLVHRRVIDRGPEHETSRLWMRMGWICWPVRWQRTIRSGSGRWEPTVFRGSRKERWGDRVRRLGGRGSSLRSSSSSAGRAAGALLGIRVGELESEAGNRPALPREAVSEVRRSQGVEAACSLRKFSKGWWETVGNGVPESSALREPRNDFQRRPSAESEAVLARTAPSVLMGLVGFGAAGIKTGVRRARPERLRSRGVVEAPGGRS